MLVVLLHMLVLLITSQVAVVVPVVPVEMDQELSQVHLFGHKVELVWVVLVKQMFIGMELP